jgi:hypothetical protein
VGTDLPPCDAIFLTLAVKMPNNYITASADEKFHAPCAIPPSDGVQNAATVSMSIGFHFSSPSTTMLSIRPIPQSPRAQIRRMHSCDCSTGIGPPLRENDRRLDSAICTSCRKCAPQGDSQGQSTTESCATAG